MKVLSLFDGISCARVALERAGIPVEEYYASEIDKYAIEVSKNNFKDVVHKGDIESLGGLQSYWCDIDLLIGGSPCQDLSIAKKGREGLKGARSGLFYEYARILKEVNPKYFILENVASMTKESRDEISEVLGVQPILINAALVSAQNRKRLFWTNIPNVTLPADRLIFLKDILEPKVDVCYEEKSRTIRSSGRGSGYGDRHNWDTIRVGDIGTTAQAHRVYDPAGKSVALSAQGGGQGAKTGLYKVDEPSGYIIRKLTPTECERLQGLPDGYTEGISMSQRYKVLGNAFNVDVVAHILSFIPKQ